MAESPDNFQGLRSFETFREYKQKWLKPNLLGDLETVFLGVRQGVKGKQRAGRGDFILAMALFSLFDHLGVFLAKRGESLEFYENIARTAHCLESTRDVFAVIANLGRNALVHGAWPQTAVPMEEKAWAFGYSVGSGPEDSEHDLLYVVEHPLRSKGHARREDAVKILKFAQNVNVLYKELVNWVDYGEELREIGDTAWDRAQRLSLVIGRPAENDRLQRIIKGKVTLCQPGTLEEQAMALKKEAEDGGAFKKIGGKYPTYYRRKGLVPQS